MPRRSRATQPRDRDLSRLPTWAALCFLASGAAGLLYEVVWFKQLSYLLGSSLHSMATVVAAFLSGLALGASLLGPRLVRLRNGARIYGALELGIAAFGVASLPLLQGLLPLLAGLHPPPGGDGSLFGVVRFAAVFVLLLPPTLLMGATLPVLVAHFEYRSVGPALAKLYALNTAGAVAGSLVAGFIAVPGIGLRATSWLAALLNVGAALLAFGAARAVAAHRVAAPAAPEPTSPRRTPDAALDSPDARAPATLPTPARIAFGLLFALSGFSALAFQVAWVRLFGLVFGSSVYSFAAVLAVYLAALALGSAMIAGRLKRGALLHGFALLQLALAVVAVASVRLFPWLPEAFLALAGRASDRWWFYYLGQIGMVAAVLAVPCALLGAVFPIAARLLQSRDGGHATGVAYAVNTAGTLLGSLLAGFVLVPGLGVQGTHLVAAFVSGAVGLGALALAAVRSERSRFGWATAAIAVLAVGFLTATAPAWDAALMSAGIYRPTVSHEVGVAASATGAAKGAQVRSFMHYDRTLFYREGINGSVYVSSDSSGRNIALRIGGKVDASTGDMLTQVLLGVVPGVCVRSGAQVAVIGLGSGFTATAALATGAGHVDVVEIEPAVVEASRFFHEPGRHPLDDPRATLVLEDARTHFATARSRYDMIVSEPSNPWMVGVNNLFTVDFYRQARARLAPDGVFCQWVQLYEISPATLGSILASFLEVFPSGHAFFTRRAEDLLLVAMPATASLSLERLREAPVVRELQRAGLPGPEAVAAFYACPFDSLRPLARGARLNRDDLPVVEYRAGRELYPIGRALLRGDPSAAVDISTTGWRTGRTLFTDWTAEAWFTGRVEQLARMGKFELARASAGEAESLGLKSLADRLRAVLETEGVGQQTRLAHEQARAAVMKGRLAEAEAILERAASVDPNHGRTWVLLAQTRRGLGDLAGAQAAGVRGLVVGDSADRAEIELGEGLVQTVRGRTQEAVARFRAAQRWQPRSPTGYLFEARALQRAGDVAGAVKACRRGLDAVPGDGELLGLMQSLGGTVQ